MKYIINMTFFATIASYLCLGVVATPVVRLTIVQA